MRPENEIEMLMNSGNSVFLKIVQILNLFQLDLKEPQIGIKEPHVAHESRVE